MAAFIWILFCHYIADFVFQSHWMASNKSKNNVALTIHVSVYTLTMAAGFMAFLAYSSGQFPGPAEAERTLLFACVTYVTHIATDYLTSRWSGRYFGLAMAARDAMADGYKLAQMRRSLFGRRFIDVKTDECLHDFFVVIGLDQFIHQATLAATIIWLGGVV